MFANQYEEHIAHSAPCSSRWDGFDRGDDGRDLLEGLDQGKRLIGRMTNGAGKRVKIVEYWCDDLRSYEVLVSGVVKFAGDDRARAIRVARWWMDGCPA